MSEPVRLRLANGVVIATTYLTWRRFLFSQAMAFNDRRPLRTSQKQSFRREYLAFCNAKLRCEDLRNPHYGGRGIEFHFANFDEFIKEVGPRPKGYVLDRINNDGNYETGNVRWVTPSQSVQNSRKNGGRPLGSKNSLTPRVEEEVTSSPRGTGSHGTLEQEASGRRTIQVGG